MSVRFPLKVTALLAVVVVIASVAASTVPLKVVPPELLIVIVPMSVPTLPSTRTVPTESITTLDLPERTPAVLVAVPEIDLTDIKPGPPLPNVRVTLSPRVIAPKITSTFGL